jgi:serine protease AprX
MVKAILRSTAAPIAGATSRDQGRGMIDVRAASAASVRHHERQQWPVADGSGSLELARGGEHVADDGVELIGEIDIMGQPWDGPRWAPLSAVGAAWSDGTWNGATWTGSQWDGGSWVTTQWTGKSWSGKSWSDYSWSGKSWSGKSWSGARWTGKSWSGKSWSGKSWSTHDWDQT